MDLYCQKCDEPYDVAYVAQDMDEDEGWKAPQVSEIFTVGAVLKTQRPSDRFKRGEGCPTCNWGKNAPKEQSLRGMAMGAMMDILGDDIDGVASMMDDFEYAGMLNEDFDDE